VEEVQLDKNINQEDFSSHVLLEKQNVLKFLVQLSDQKGI
jgi:hypothetical protein